MAIKLIQCSLVVIANDHNPTIINPNFLAQQEIIKSDWGWSVTGEPITTPPFAMVTYSNGVTITVETNKLQVTDDSGTSPVQSKIEEIVKKYVKVLQHIPYKAVGINFRSTVNFENPGAFLKQHFLRKGNWDTDHHPLQSMGLKLVYSLSDGRIVLTFEHARKFGNPPQDLILVNSNFHRDCVGPNHVYGQVLEALVNVRNDWNRNKQIVKDALMENNFRV